MKKLLAVAGVSTLIGCSSVGTRSHARSASAEASRDAELTALRLQLEEQDQELRTVRGQLALARAEVQELRGPEHVDSEPATTVDGESVDPPLPDERLPVTADVPDLPPFVDDESQTARTHPPEQVSIEGYRRGLSLLREQRFGDALVELEAFSSAHPGHPYADNALFWCGEIHYLQHQYAKALRYFERIEKLYPWGNKAPDALYRTGQIYLRRGDRARAQSYFDKVREQFPDTAAARLALREDAS